MAKAKRKKPAHRYPGELGRVLSGTPKQVDRVRLTSLLLQHYGIDPRDDEFPLHTLALKLAEAHVPAFQPPPQRKGRPTKWTLKEYVLLLECLDIGKALLRAERRPITDVDALEATYLHWQAKGWLPQLRRAETRKIAKAESRLISKARNACDEALAVGGAPRKELMDRTVEVMRITRAE